MAADYDAVLHIPRSTARAQPAHVWSPTETARFCNAAQEAPALPGAYVLHIELTKKLKVTLARRPPVTLPPGRYLYCGSAHGPGGLRARLARHFARDKVRRWHIDQLSTQGSVAGSWIVPGGDECALVRLLSHLPVPIARFGSSDCRTCRSHLLHWPEGMALPPFYEASHASNT